MHSLFIHII